MGKEVIKSISYLPKKSVEITAVRQKMAAWKIAGIAGGSVAFLIFAVLTGAFGGYIFLISFFALAISLVRNSKYTTHQLIEFTKRRVTLRMQGRDVEDNQEIAHVLKSPLYLDIIIQQKEDSLMEVRFEQYGEKIGKTIIRGEELTYLLDSLNDLLGLEIKESRSTTTKEDILYLRPIDSDNIIMPSYIKVVDNPMRLIVNPTSNARNFIINNQRNIIKTAKGKTFNIHDIVNITVAISGTTIIMTALLRSNKFEEIIKFKAKKYAADIIEKDIQNFIDFLKSKDNLQHIQFKIEA